MDLQSYLNEAESVERDGVAAIASAADADALEAARIAFLGDRQGRVKALQEALRTIAKEDKPAAGKRFNEARSRLDAALADRSTTIARAAAVGTREDLSLPARRQWRGAKHPVTLVIEEIEEIFREAREYCVSRSQTCRGLIKRKFFYVFTCEYCFSHYVVAFFLFLTRYHLLLDDWRGYLLSFFALAGLTNVYLSLFGRLRVEIKSERLDVAAKEEADSSQAMR